MRKSLMTKLTVNMMEYYSDLALTWDRGGMQCWRSWSGHSLPHHVMPQEPHNTLQWPLELTPLSWLLPHTITHSQIIQIRHVLKISLTFGELMQAEMICILSLARCKSIRIAKKPPSSFEEKLIFSILEWSTCNTAEEHGHSFAWLYLQRFPDVFTDDPCHVLAPGYRGPMSGHQHRLEVGDNNDAASIIYEARIYSEKKLLICTLIGYKMKEEA